MTFLTLFLAFGLPVSNSVVVEEVDRIELNHVVYYSPKKGEIVSRFSQYIFWDDCRCDREGCRGRRVVAWRLAEKVHNFPSKTGSRYRLIFQDENKLRDIRSRLFLETVNQTTDNLQVPSVVVDPEILDRPIHKERTELKSQ